MYYYKQWLEWRLTIRVFDFIAIGGVDIIGSSAKIFAKKAKISFATPTISKNEKKYRESSQGKDLIRFSNEQNRLTE